MRRSRRGRGRMTKGGTLSLNRNEKADRGDGRGGPGGPLADARAGRVPWHHRRTPERAAQDRAREGRLSSRAEEHARSPRRRRTRRSRWPSASMVGPLIYGFSEDAVAAAKVVCRLRQEQRQAGRQGRRLRRQGARRRRACSRSPRSRRRKCCSSQLLGLMQSPISRIARVLAVLAEKRGGGAEAPAEPAPSRRSSTRGRLITRPQQPSFRTGISKWHSIKTHSSPPSTACR